MSDAIGEPRRSLSVRNCLFGKELRLAGEKSDENRRVLAGRLAFEGHFEETTESPRQRSGLRDVVN